MRRKRKQKKFTAVSAVKALAREHIGTPASGRVIAGKKKRVAEKHKPTLGKLLNEE